MKVYLVIYESYIEQFGSYTSLLGVFTSEDMANIAIGSYYEQIKEYYNTANDEEKKILRNVMTSDLDVECYYKPQIRKVYLDEIQGIVFQGYFNNITINGEIAIGLGGYAE